MIKLYYVFIGIIFLFIISGCDKEELDFQQAHEKVIMRKVGHEILLLSNDSTSLVRPIIFENDKYRIQFDSSFSFLPADLVVMIDTIIRKELPLDDYLVQVEACESKEVIYSYETDVFSSVPFPDAVACKKREQPKACYEIVIQFIREQDQKQKNSLLYVLLFAAIILIGLILYLKKKKKIKEGKIVIGAYLYDPKKMTLTLINNTIELTSKESELLNVLYESVNETVNREKILNMVWGDEGDYVGRTLDVYISKLRKKLENDTSVEIKNIRGIGYKMIVS